jgi:hypothetical protein
MSIRISPQAMIAALDRDEILQALGKIAQERIPRRRRSTKFCLAHQGRHYPPKLVISFASDLRPEDFAGGQQSNEALRKLNFTIVSCNCGGLSGGRGYDDYC